MTTTSNNARLSEWINEMIARKGVRLELWSTRAGSPLEQITYWPIDDKADIEKIAGQIVRDAENDGIAQPGQSITYMVQAFEATDRRLHRFHVVVPGLGSKPGAGGAEMTQDVSDLAGVLAQLMRTNNEQSQIIIRCYQGREDSYQRQIDNLSRQLEIEQKRALEATQLYHKMTSLDFEQKRIQAASDRAAKNDEYIRSSLSDMIPFLLNRFAGGGPGKGAPAAGMLFERIFEHFTPEQVAALAESPILNDQQKLMLFELYQSFVIAKPKKLNQPDEGGGAANGQPQS